MFAVKQHKAAKTLLKSRPARLLRLLSAAPLHSLSRGERFELLASHLASGISFGVGVVMRVCLCKKKKKSPKITVTFDTLLHD